MKKLLPALILPLLFAPSAQAEDILSILERQAKIERAAPPAVNPYNYTVDVQMSGKEGDDDEVFTAKLFIDPSLTPENRVTILSASSDDYPDEFEEFLKETRNAETSAEDLAEEFWCESGDNDLFDDDGAALESLTVISETQSEAVIKPDLALMAKIMMDGDGDEDMSKSERKMMKKMMERMDGEFVLSKPDARLKSFNIWLTRPLTMAIVAKIKEMDVTQSCALAPNGFTYTDRITMHVKVKALGVGMEQNMDIQISDLTLR